MTAGELEQAVCEWIQRRASKDDLLAGRVPGLPVETVERTTDLRRPTDDLQWSAVEPLRTETEIPEHVLAEEVGDVLDDRLDDFMPAVGAALLAEAAGPTVPPQDLRSAIRGPQRISAAIFPKGYQPPPAAPMPALPFPTCTSEAEPSAAVLVYGPGSGYRLKFDCTVRQTGPMMKIMVAATPVRAPARPCIARVPVP